MSKERVLAIHLPQFHPVAINDKTWGKGFTEWTNVARAKPLFRHHAQPKIPADLGFYDLRLEDSRKAQAELAQAYGIEGFCYYHYWFEGVRVLEHPVEEILRKGSPDIPFCLFWANESWSRRWLGEEKDIILSQTYSHEDDVRHAKYLAKVFADKRYIRTQGRPVFLIYRPADLPEPGSTVEVIKNEAMAVGLPEPYLIASNGHCEHIDFRSNGFDAMLNFEPQLSVLPDFMEDRACLSKLQRNIKLGVFSAKLKLYSYQIAKDLMEQRVHPYPAHPCVFVGWDNSARRGRNGIIIVQQNIERFEQSLERAKKIAGSKELEEKFVFINAWNEWAEGNYLEPDFNQGHTFLEAIKRTFST